MNLVLTFALKRGIEVCWIEKTISIIYNYDTKLYTNQHEVLENYDDTEFWKTVFKSKDKLLSYVIDEDYVKLYNTIQVKERELKMNQFLT